MHMVIRAIVYAEDGLSALVEARKLFDRLCGEDKVFDYSKILGIAVRAEFREGRELIDEAMKFQEAEFKHNLKEVRKKIFFPRRFIMEDRTWRDCCYNLQAYASPNCWLYDGDGEGITTKDHLKNVLNKWECLAEQHRPDKDLKIFVVPVDVHH